MPYYYGFDWTYLVIGLPCLLLSLWAQVSVNSTFKKYSRQFSSRNITAAEAAEIVLRYNQISYVGIEHVDGNLTDHYDSRSNVIRLSQNVYYSSSTAAIGVACHEAGHAVQYAQDYSPIRIRAAIIPITNIGSKLALPLILAGVLFSFLGNFSTVLIYTGILCFSLSLIFQLVTLPVEINASSRALTAIRQAGILNSDEIVGAKKTLRAAAMTYVAAVAVSLGQLLRLVLLFGNRRNHN